jgi:hypothetical protein
MPTSNGKSLGLLILAVGIASAALGQTNSSTDPQKAYRGIKNMPGYWEGKASDGRPIRVDFKVTGGGSAVMSEIVVPNEDMISVLQMDEPNRLFLTHHCAAGNQPRRQASVSSDGKIIAFNYVDATNRASPDSGHMQRMVPTLLDHNHHREEWTFLEHGQEHKEGFDLHRPM